MLSSDPLRIPFSGTSSFNGAKIEHPPTCIHEGLFYLELGCHLKTLSRLLPFVLQKFKVNPCSTPYDIKYSALIQIGYAKTCMFNSFIAGLYRILPVIPRMRRDFISRLRLVRRHAWQHACVLHSFAFLYACAY